MALPNTLGLNYTTSNTKKWGVALLPQLIKYFMPMWRLNYGGTLITVSKYGKGTLNVHS